MGALAKVWWIPPLVAAGIAATLDRHADAGDVIFFAHAGEELFGRGWAEVFADPSLQSGPLQLAVLGALARVADAFGIPLGVMLAFAVELGATAAALLVLKRITSNRAVLLLAGLGVVVLGLSAAAYIDGHPAQLFIPLLWVLAGLAVRDGRGGQAGILVGLSAGLELWGLLGVCLLAALPGIRPAARGLAGAALVTAGLLAPFVALGEFSMFAFDWHVASGTLVSLVVEPGSTYPWAVRLVQAVAAVAAGASVAWALRTRPSVIWVAPLAAVLVRLLFDPVFYGTYLLAPLTLAAIGAAEFLTGDLVREVRRRRSKTRAPGQGAVASRR
jgi:hypothetical protein